MKLSETCAEASDTRRLPRPCSCFMQHLSTSSPEHQNQQAQLVPSTAGDPGSTNKVEMPIRRNCKQSGEGLLIKKLLTYVKSNQGLYTDKLQSFNLNLVSVHDKSFDNSVPKSHRSKTSIADELIVITTRCVR